MNTKIHKDFLTPKGTALPIMDIRGKPYLQVAHRIVWFREEKPDWIISTHFVQLEATYAICKAEIADETGKVRVTAHKKEDQKGFADFIEKAETSSVGRALALLGYGTQFAADELDEGDRLADSPMEAARPKEKAPPKIPHPFLEDLASINKKLEAAGIVSDVQKKGFLQSIVKKESTLEWNKQDIDLVNERIEKYRRNISAQPARP